MPVDQGDSPSSLGTSLSLHENLVSSIASKQMLWCSAIVLGKVQKETVENLWTGAAELENNIIIYRQVNGSAYSCN